MKNQPTVRPLSVLLSGLLGLSAAACAAAPLTTGGAALQVEETASSGFTIDRVRVRPAADALSVSGDVARVVPRRGFIPGQVEVRLLGPDGAVLAAETATPMRRNRQARSAHFFVRLPVQPVAGGQVQIIYHRG